MGQALLFLGGHLESTRVWAVGGRWGPPAIAPVVQKNILLTTLILLMFLFFTHFSFFFFIFKIFKIFKDLGYEKEEGREGGKGRLGPRLAARPPQAARLVPKDFTTLLSV